MTGGRCHRRRKMTAGRGVVGDCGAEEEICLDSRVPARIPANSPESLPEVQEVDFYAQAGKALCLRSPFDGSDEAAQASGVLPRSLAGFVSRHLDSRKRQKKSHLSADNQKKKKASSRQSERSKAPSIWADTEDYFRDLTMLDIENLSKVAKPSNNSASTLTCFLIPVLKDDYVDKRANENGNANENDVTENESKDCEKENGTVVNEEIEKTEEKDACKKENGVVGEEETNIEEDGQPMEIDNVEDDGLPQSHSVPEFPRGVEWLLGARNKVSTMSERGSKKRKLPEDDAGLEKVLVAFSCEGNSSLCHFCSACDTGNEFNPLVSCSSCQVSVHRKCYGVKEEDTGSSWLCSWCKHKTIRGTDAEKPCILCPKKGGALKPVSRNVQNEGPADFAHLFCSQWTPGVYVDDLEKMEPIMNVEAVKGARKKLVCNICKVKWGACVRCCYGTCRSSFHPLCAREARHRMEVWGRYGCDNVELRAFCLKHSEVVDNNNIPKSGDTTVVAGTNSNSVSNLHEKSKVGCRNGDNTAIHAEVPDTNSDRSLNSESQDTGLPCSKLNARLVSGCNDSQLNNVEGFERGNEDVKALESSNFAFILKKLIDRGRINMEDVASQIGITVDSLSASLADDTMVPDVQCKIVNWLKNNVHLSALQKNLKVKTRSKASSNDEFGAVDDSDVIPVSESDIANHVAVKSVPPRRRTKSSIRILNDPKMLCSSEEIFSDKETAVDEVKVDQLVDSKPENLSEVSISQAIENNLTDPRAVQHDTRMSLSESSRAESLHSIPQESGQVEEVSVTVQDDLVNADAKPTCSAAGSAVPSLQDADAKAVPSYYIHPDIEKKLLQLGLNSPVMEFSNGSRDGKAFSIELSTDDMGCKDGVLHSEQLVKARDIGVLELAPEDEVEGEIIYLQNRLLSNAASRKGFTDKLICSVAKNLPLEIDMAHARRWDAVLVNRYLSELKEAKKQGRKERRHKEAQAVLAAATAAAAASSRMSTFRKDGDETNHQEGTTASGRPGSCSQSIPRAKETLQRVAAPRISLEKHSDLKESVVDFSKEHPKSCDVCRRSETLLNPILVCCSCKVAVHLDCYRSVKESTGPWYCELCEELSTSRSSGAPAVNFWDKPYFVAECGLCGSSSGAFRKSSDGQWVHAFCAEWVFESKFRRGQVNSVEGMDTISKAADLCHICQRKAGICIKCNYGHCQATFHPWCARNAGFYLNVKTSGGKQQHKAYCEKHSVEQRAKAETQKHGVEELKSLKQVRVELERLRLLCERLIKREKLKRELVLCSHDILAVKRDHAARSILVRTPYLLPDVSSESVTTSLKGHTDAYSEAIQRSDDVTVDSTVSTKRRGKASGTADDQRTEDDCSTSQNQFPRKPSERPQFSGKQIPNRPSSIATRNLMEDGWRSKPKKPETFEKELVMTSDQASVKNMRLPKGYAYVPADFLSNEKQTDQETGPGEPLEHGG